MMSFTQERHKLSDAIDFPRAPLPTVREQSRAICCPLNPARANRYHGNNYRVLMLHRVTGKSVEKSSNKLILENISISRN